MIREGAGEPLVLLHGVTGSAELWRTTIPYLADHHDVIVPSALGHDGGAVPGKTPVRFADLLDDLEGRMDGLGLEKAHLAGNSMGGWMAIEMARRGRALSVCALSPAGTWDSSSGVHLKTREVIRGTMRDARRFRSLVPFVAPFAPLRHRALLGNAEHGERVSREDFVRLARASLACTVVEDILVETDQIKPLDPAPCPITIAWSEKDRILPLHTNGAQARERVPGAKFIVLEDVGHVPMFDDPALVARTILDVTGARAG